MDLMEAFQLLEISINQDGTYNKKLRFEHQDMPATGDQIPHFCDDVALSKDISLPMAAHGTYMRIFKPVTALSSTAKLPIILYFPGGGFIRHSPASYHFHQFCGQMAADLSVLVLSVGYRLAPEYRLPAAYTDALDAIHWIYDQSQQLQTNEIWLRRADFSKLFIMGNCSGGNIAFHAAILAIEQLNLNSKNSITLCGLILDQPACYGEERTKSELKMANDPILPLNMMDAIYRLALPEGANRDHVSCNLLKNGDKMNLLPRCLITGFFGDPLIDRHQALAQMLRDKGVSVVTRFKVGGYHGAYLYGIERVSFIREILRSFMNDTSSTSRPPIMSGARVR